MRWYLYKTTNNINGKEYIGVHKTSNFNDSYIGCGVSSKKSALSMMKNGPTIFRAAVVKHGYKNFSKEILEVFDNEEDAYNREKQVVNEEWVRSPRNYNMCIGGRNASFIDLETVKIVVKDLEGKILGCDKPSEIERKSNGRFLAKCIKIASSKKSKYKNLVFERIDSFEGLNKIEPSALLGCIWPEQVIVTCFDGEERIAASRDEIISLAPERFNNNISRGKYKGYSFRKFNLNADSLEKEFNKFWFSPPEPVDRKFLLKHRTYYVYKNDKLVMKSLSQKEICNSLKLDSGTVSKVVNKELTMTKGYKIIYKIK